VNVHATTEDENDDKKGQLLQGTAECIWSIPKVPHEIFLGGLNTKVGREDVFKPTIRNETSREIGSNNGVKVVNFAT
jgi:hypothetical protein